MANPVGREGYQQFHNEPDGDTVTVPSNPTVETRNPSLSPPVEDTSLFQERIATENSLTPEQAFIHLVKAMLGTGLLSLPLAFKHAGLFLGLILTIIICAICLYCMRQVVFAAHFVCNKNGRDLIDYANILRGAVEMGPPWIRHRGYFFKQLLNVNMFISQFGFCCVYFVFMADNLEDFFKSNTSINLSKAEWMLVLLIPMLAFCSVRRLSILAPFAMIANVVYICAVAIVLFFFLSNLRPVSSLPWFGRVVDLPLYFGTVMFAFEGVAVVMPIENRMRSPHSFIAWNGVLNTSCFVVLAIFSVTGFYGYLSLGDTVKDTATLNLPMTPWNSDLTLKIKSRLVRMKLAAKRETTRISAKMVVMEHQKETKMWFYQTIKLMFVGCIMVSFPLQFYVPMERVEKWITRKIPVDKQTKYIYVSRWGGVLLTCAVAELIPHLALFIALIGAFSGASMALVFPPCIDLLTMYAKKELTRTVWIKNLLLLSVALLGFTTGTYAALSDIFKTYS